MRSGKKGAIGQGAIGLGALLGLALCLPAQAPLTPSVSAANASVMPAPSVEDRADLLIAERNYAAAIGLLEDTVRRNHATAGIYNRLGMAYQEAANQKQAEKSYKSAIKLDRRNPTYLNNLGTVYYMRRKYKDAAKEFTAALRLNTTVAAYYVNLGGAEFAQRRFQPALAAYRQALRLDPNALFPSAGVGPVMQNVNAEDTPRYHYDLARLFCSMGMIDDAVHQFRQAYELHYANLKQSLADPAFAPLRQRPEYKALMGLPPNSPPGPSYL